MSATVDDHSHLHHISNTQTMSMSLSRWFPTFCTVTMHLSAATNSLVCTLPSTHNVVWMVGVNCNQYTTHVPTRTPRLHTKPVGSLWAKCLFSKVSFKYYLLAVKSNEWYMWLQPTALIMTTNLGAQVYRGSDIIHGVSSYVSFTEVPALIL